MGREALNNKGFYTRVAAVSSMQMLFYSANPILWKLRVVGLVIKSETNLVLELVSGDIPSFFGYNQEHKGQLLNFEFNLQYTSKQLKKFFLLFEDRTKEALLIKFK